MFLSKVFTYIVIGRYINHSTDTACEVSIALIFSIVLETAFVGVYVGVYISSNRILAKSKLGVCFIFVAYEI